MRTPTLFCALIVVFLLLGLGQKLYELRARGSDPLRRAVCLCLASLAAATIAQLFGEEIDDVGLAHLVNAISDVGAMIAAHAGRLFLIHVNHPARLARMRARRSHPTLLVALIAVVILFIAFPAPSTEPSYTEGVYFYVYICYLAGRCRPCVFAAIPAATVAASAVVWISSSDSPARRARVAAVWVTRGSRYGRSASWPSRISTTWRYSQNPTSRCHHRRFVGAGGARASSGLVCWSASQA